MIINLQNYLNQEVQIELRNGEGYIGVVQEWRDSCFTFRFKIGNAPQYYNTQGYYNNSVCADPHDIVSIKPFTKTMKFTGLAQKHPNIDLNKFRGKTVLIRLNKEYMCLQAQFIGKVFDVDADTWDAVNSDFAAEMLCKVSVERIREELEKMFLADTLWSLDVLNSVRSSVQKAIFRGGLRLMPTLRQ